MYRRRDGRPADLGVAGEDAAAAWYEANGYEVIARNWRCREGELDLVVRRARTIVFCEVKTRTTDRFGAPAEAVTRRSGSASASWRRSLAHRCPGAAREIRFDVAAVMGGVVEVIEGAF